MTDLREESTELAKKIQLIKDVVSMQQNYTKGAEFKELIMPIEVLDKALIMQLEALARHDIKVVKNFKITSPILAQQSKLIHVLLNLIKNAKESMVANPQGVKVLTLELEEDNGVRIKVTDTGAGIAQENMDKIFVHGFTTKTKGHGFGLHYCANAITEMGGRLSVSSDGKNKGATFTVHFDSANQKKEAV